MAPKICLGASLHSGGRVLLAIVDSGPGLPPEQLDQIFFPFITTKKNGLGIGLAICQKITQRHNSIIGVRSEPEAQTIFTLSFGPSCLANREGTTPRRNINVPPSPFAS